MESRLARPLHNVARLVLNAELARGAWIALSERSGPGIFAFVASGTGRGAVGALLAVEPDRAVDLAVVPGTVEARGAKFQRFFEARSRAEEAGEAFLAVLRPLQARHVVESAHRAFELILPFHLQR